MAELKRLKTKRGNIKRKLTAFIKLVDEAEAPESHDEVQRRLADAKCILSEFEPVHTEIVVLEDETPENIAYQDEFEASYYAIIEKAHKFLKENAPAPERDEDTVVNVQTFNADVRLPKIDLPTFDGSYDKWLCFCDTYKSIVHTRSRYSNVTKFHYLRSCLKDEAAAIIQSLEISEANYEAAWALLVERYDNHRVIIQNHLKALFDQSSFTRESAINVRKLLDNINKHTRALKALGQPVDKWDTLLIYCMSAKLDKTTHQEWEKSIKTKKMPSLQEFLSFLTTRAQILEATEVQIQNQSSNTKNTSSSQKKSVLSLSQKPEHCNYCSAEHKTFKCEKFHKLTPSERLEAVKKIKMCFNCLRKGHTSDACTCGPCKKCSKKHHTLLHLDRQNTNSSQSNVTIGSLQITTSETEPSESQKDDKIVCGNLRSDDSSQIVLATARVTFFDSQNKPQTARVVLDAGAQAHFISEKLAKMLNLQRIKTNVPVVAINQMETTIRHKIEAAISSTNGKFKTNLCFLVVPHVSAPLPSQQINAKKLQIPKNLPLADPAFHKSSEIDALIGAELFYNILCAKQIAIQNSAAILQKTRFGWIVAGKIANDMPRAQPISCNLSLQTINHDIARFWELEEIPDKKFLSQEEADAEQHFIETFTRDHTGKYVVRLPFNDKITKLCSTYNIARKQFLALERRFSRHPEIKTPYVASMREYIDLGHMTEVTDPYKSANYMPHHAVIKSDSTTTKCRPVFNGSVIPEYDSMKSNDDINTKPERITFNQTLLKGPTIQKDIFDILVRFRVPQFVFVADIEKMYRQVLVHPEDRKFQQIFWRENENDPLKIYQLNTLTFGTTCAPFSAIRTIHQLADDEQHNFPVAAEAVKRDFYVDDLMTGSNTFENAEKLRDELNNLMKSGGFNLRKWASNDKRLIDPLPIEQANVELFRDPYKSIKTLGIHWNSQVDQFSYAVKSDINDQLKVTKRSVLSCIAQLFDPVGLLGPVMVRAKLIMQELWKLNVDWDECLPLSIHSAWLDYKKQLPLISKISFPRGLLIAEPVNIQLHGFSDASEAAYGTCFYIRSIDKENNCITELICSKSKVAPLNSKTTIPKLELCTALLLANLYKVLSSILPINFNDVYFWSDSTITLNWINTQPHILKTFVANRVSQIRLITNCSNWHHVPTKDNPADFISRGQAVSEFLENDLWRNGPTWLKENENKWPNLPIQQGPLLEVRQTTVLKVTLKDASILKRFSSFTTLSRVTAYCLRFVKNCLRLVEIRKNKSSSQKPTESTVKNAEITKPNPLLVREILASKYRIIRLIQNQAFAKEFYNLSKNKPIDNTSSLKTLNPFIDNNNIIRVGGRIENSYLPYDSRHPIVLPKHNHVTDLIIEQEHLRSKHAGIQNTLYQVRTQYWPIDGKNITRRIVHSCVPCARFRHAIPKHIMGNLPTTRVIVSRAFINTGVDYCGPFFIKEKKFRNRNKVKVYVAIFVCFATKAVHLEVVSDLTTDTFLACLRRFFARRGKCKNMYSDNGTNFVGANNELKRLYEFLRSDEASRKIVDQLANEAIVWHFIPARSPHFGGLWEAAVKSFKSHFMRTVGNTFLTYEEFTTHTTEIEAILNSRPLTPLSNDPNDLIALTPAHFLINDSMTNIPEEDFSEIPTNRLSKWEQLQKLKQHFWQRWQKEYLNELNTRAKWTAPSNTPINIGTMVLLKEDNTSPLQWPLGRIVDVHPGDDGVIRVVTVKTSTGIFKRSVKKIAVLPIETRNS